MRLKASSAGVLATGALLFAVPAAASASTSSASPARAANTPSATASQFAQIADGQSVAQVDQEMGGAGIVTSAVSDEHGVVQVVAWRDSSLGLLGGLVRFSVDFGAPAAGQPLTVTGETALGISL